MAATTGYRCDVINGEAFWVWIPEGRINSLPAYPALSFAAFQDFFLELVELSVFPLLGVKLPAIN